MHIGTGKSLSFVAMTVASLILSSCGGGSTSSNSGGSGGNPTDTDVVFSFAGGVAPLAVAEQFGTGAWTKASAPTNGQLTVTVPNGTNNYAVAYVCPTWQGMGPVNQETIIEATLTDGTAFTVSCFQNPTPGVGTGSANGTAIAGVTGLRIAGTQGYGAYLNTPSGSFNTNFAKGANDIAVVGLDNSSNVLGVKIVRGQTVPGAINSNNTIMLAASDATTPQSIAVTNIPSGFTSPAAVAASYWTASGTFFELMNNTSPTQYAAVPVSQSQSGDYYSFTANTASGSHQSLYVATTATSSGSVILQMPAPLTYDAPAPAALPTFTVNYSGFSGATASGDLVTIQWFINTSTLEYLSVYATSSSLNGVTTLTVPDLTALSGFFKSATSGATVDWAAEAYGGSFHLFTPSPSTGSIAIAEASGQFTEP